MPRLPSSTLLVTKAAIGMLSLLIFWSLLVMKSTPAFSTWMEMANEQKVSLRQSGIRECSEMEVHRWTSTPLPETTNAKKDLLGYPHSISRSLVRKSRKKNKYLQVCLEMGR